MAPWSAGSTDAMAIEIDHAVLATDDPDATAEVLTTRLGLTAAAGGRHDTLGTFNRLVWLGDAYLELVGVFDQELASRSWFGAVVLASLERGGGLATWAIAVDDLEVAIRWAPPATLIGPADGERRRPDDRVVRWRLARPAVLGPATPFLIEHDHAAAEWTPAERAARADERHDVGGRVRLTGIEVQVDSPPGVAGRIRSILSAPVEPAGRGAVRVRLGDQEVRFVTTRPGSAAVVDLVTDVAIRTRVGRIGDTEIRLRGTAPPAGAVVGQFDDANRKEPVRRPLRSPRSNGPCPDRRR